MISTRLAAPAKASVPNLMVPNPAAPPAGRTNVMAFLDGTEETVEPFLCNRLDDLEKAAAKAGPNFSATATMYRAGSSAPVKIAKGAAVLGLNVALPLVGHMLGGTHGLVVGGLASAAMLALGVTRQGLGWLESGVLQAKHFHEPRWAGQRTYVVTPDQTDKIDSKPTSENPYGQISPEDLTQYLTSNMKPYQTNILFVAGHGLGYRQTANLTVRDWRGSLETAARQTGAKPDVLLLESCLMGNMEAMNELRNSARVAVVSEETLNVNALPLKEMLVDATVKGGTPQEIGKRMVQLAGAGGEVQTLVAVDLQKMDPFMQSLDRLGTNLSAEIDAGNRAPIRAAMKEAQRYPQGNLFFLERRVFNFSDLGGFLDALQRKNLSPATQATVAQAKATLADTIIARTASPKYAAASGMSFQTKDSAMLKSMIQGGEHLGSYNALDLPPGWRGFTSKL